MRTKQFKGLALTTLTLSILILAISIVSAAVTAPMPRNIELTPGQSSQFSFQIQQADNFDIVCKYVPENLGILEISLDNEYQVAAGQSITVKGTVTLPSSAAPADYQATFCMECSPKTTEGGSSIKIRYCNDKYPLTIQGVSERTRTNQYDKEGTSLLWLILLIVLIILVLLTWYILKKKKRV